MGSGALAWPRKNTTTPLMNLTFGGNAEGLPYAKVETQGGVARRATLGCLSHYLPGVDRC
jgi:hypothetical protein